MKGFSTLSTLVRRGATALVLIAISAFPPVGGWRVHAHGGAFSSRNTFLLVDQVGRTLLLDGPSHVRVLTQAPAVRHLSRDATFPVPAPDGRRIAVGRGSAGLWLVRRDGTSFHRLVVAPRSCCQNEVRVDQVAWSPDGQRLAYSVSLGGDVIRMPIGGEPDQRRLVGVWLTRLDHPHPHRVSGLPITRLAWPKAGQALIASAFLRSDCRRTCVFAEAVVRINRVTHRWWVVIRRGGDMAVSPSTGAVAYITGGRNFAQPSRSQPTQLWIADPDGRNRRVLVQVRGPILSPTWSPDGRSVAYLGGTLVPGAPGYPGGATGLYVADVASRTTHEVVLVPRPAKFFQRVAWMPTSSP